MGIAGSINSSIDNGTYNSSINNDMIDEFIRDERHKALLSQSSSFLYNQTQHPLSSSLESSSTTTTTQPSLSSTMQPALLSTTERLPITTHILNDDDDDIDEYSGDDLSLWLRIIGIHPHIADMTTTLASFREIYTPQELYDEWIVNRSILESLECLSSNDISDILNSRLFRRNIAKEQISIQQSRDDIIQQLEQRCRQIQDVEQSLIEEMIQRQISMDSMKEEMLAREMAREEQSRRTRAETQMEMIEILEAAMGMSMHGSTSSAPYHSFDMNSYRQEYECFSDLLDQACDLNNPLLNLNNDSPSRAPNDRRSSSKEIIGKWDLRMSSPVLDYSSDASSAVRRGNVGNYPAAFVAGGSMNVCLSIKLEEYPKRIGLFSFGFTVLCPQSKILTGLTSSDERVFGKSLLSWGIVDNRYNNSPCEIWGNNQKCCTFRTLFEGDVLSIRLDIFRGVASLQLNGSEIFTFQDVMKNEQFIFGSILPVDHKITIIERDILDEPEPEAVSLLRSRTESSIVAVSNQSGRQRNIVLPTPEEILSSSPLNSPIPPSRLLTSSTRSTRSQQQQSRTITSSSTTSQRIAAHVYPEPKKVESTISTNDTNDTNSTSAKVDESNLCCICLEEPKSTVLLPCRHLCLCRVCGDNEDIESCPICRSNIITRMTVYL